MQMVNVREARERISRLLDAVATGQEVVIMRRGKPVAKLVGISGEEPRALRFPDRQDLRDTLPPAVKTSGELVRELRDERY